MTQMDQSQKAGRGALYLSLTKLYFILGSFGINFGFKFAAESDVRGTEILGVYKQVGSLLSVVSTVLVMGTTLATSRFVARSGASVRGVLMRILSIEVGIGVLCGLLFFFIAPRVAAGESAASTSAELIPALKIAALIPLTYAIYACFMGTLNGQMRFGHQALLDATFTTLKFPLVLLGVALWQNTQAAYGGFVLCAILVTIIGAILTLRGVPKGEGDPTGAIPRRNDILLFQIQTVAFMFFVQWLVQMDIWYLQAFHEDLGDGGFTAARSLYAGFQLFSQLSYSVVIALTLALFPLVSTINFDQEPARAAGYIKETLRYALILIGAAVALLTSRPQETLSILMGRVAVSELLQAFPGQEWGMIILGAGFGLFALAFVICCSFNAAARSKTATCAMVSGVGIQFAMARVLIPDHGILGCCIATAWAMSVVFLTSATLAHRMMGNVMPWTTVVRVGAAIGALLIVSSLFPEGGLLMTLIRWVVCGLVFVGTLIAIRELTGEDLKRLKNLRRGAGS